MEIVAITDMIESVLVARCARALQSGGIVVSPTDTVYGILGDAAQEDAVQRMFAIKSRPEEKAFPIFVENIAMARYYAYISDAKAKFLERVWPGAVTVLFDHKGKLPQRLTGDALKIGIRIPAHSFVAALLASVHGPLAQTSANISGQPPAKNKDELLAYFSSRLHQPDLIIDAGEAASDASTVIDFSGTNPLIVRSGLMTKQELDLLLKN